MNTPAFLFDLDGTLVDSVYQHVLAWREALEEVGLELSVWRIHRRIGMSGGLFLDALLRETGRRFGADEAAAVRRTHAAAFARLVGAVKPLPGARDLLKYLTNAMPTPALTTPASVCQAPASWITRGLNPASRHRAMMLSQSSGSAERKRSTIASARRSSTVMRERDARR